ncbi:MAG: serine dehydratase subunit alpha family protein [Clostridia bacterium]|nr:serine dehydratase subunit alpha family protein [Clostridia bacterium]
MDKTKYNLFLQILKEELIPAMGCTEPAAIAYAGAKVKSVLSACGEDPTHALIEVSGNIVKNVKSVTVPNTCGLKGIEAALCAGIALGNHEKELSVLSEIKEADAPIVAKFLETFPVKVKRSCSDEIFEIAVTLYSNNHSAYIKLIGDHTNVTIMKLDDEILFENTEALPQKHSDRSALSVESIIEFADSVNLDDIRDVLERQIECNMAIAEEGLKNNYGANIGKVYLSRDPKNIKVRAKAYAAAGSDARMNGCELPVIINSGSGNQGMTTSIPVIVYAKHLGVGHDLLLRALCLSNLLTIHLKTGIGTLSAYCGVISAGAAAACGIVYLRGGKMEAVAHTLVNALASSSGIICDGAKASCAAKIALAVESGLLGMDMYYHDCEFYAGDGIVKNGVEATIESVSRLAYKGMKETDKEIISIMIDD